MRDPLAVRLDVQHHNTLFDRHCRREPLTRCPWAVVVDPLRENAFDGGRRGAKVRLRTLQLEVRLWLDDCAAAAWVFDVLDPYGDFSPNDLVSVFFINDVSLLEVTVRTCSIINGCTTSLP